MADIILNIPNGREDFRELNTRQFFEKTAHFASLARTKFSINRFPSCLEKNKLPRLPNTTELIYTDDEIEMFDIAKKLLSKGILAKSVTLPQQSLMLDNGFSYGGPTRKHPLGQQFSDIDVEFLLMGSTEQEARSIYFLFSEWQKLIAGPRNIRSNEIPRSDSTAFAVEYYDNYVAEADITILSPSIKNNFNSNFWGGAVSVVKNKYSELYPSSIGSIFTSWDSSDTPASLSVTFCYYYSTYQTTY